MSESRLNIELFKAVREKIATTPAAYDQEIWGRTEKAAPCGTAACLAGWACVLSEKAALEQVRLSRRDGYLGDLGHVGDVAREALGIDEDEADTLFQSNPGGEWEDYDDDGDGVYYGGWPEPFDAMWREAGDNPTAEAAVAAAFIDHIIKTGCVLE